MPSHALEALLVPRNPRFFQHPKSHAHCAPLDALEQEPEQMYKSISMRQIHQMRFPVELAVRNTHLRITSVNPSYDDH